MAKEAAQKFTLLGNESKSKSIREWLLDTLERGEDNVVYVLEEFPRMRVEVLGGIKNEKERHEKRKILDAVERMYDSYISASFCHHCTIVRHNQRLTIPVLYYFSQLPSGGTSFIFPK